MSETIVFEAVVTVTNTKSEIHDAIAHFRSANYGALPSTLGWDSAPQKGAMATLQDNCPRDGHVLIHLYALKSSGYSLVIQAIQREVSAARSEDAPEVKAHTKVLYKAIRQTLSLLTEQFTVPDTLNSFVMWVNEYGYRRQSNYIPHHPERKRDGGFQLFHGISSADNRSIGEIIFHIELDSNVVMPSFTATAEPYSGLNPVRSEVIDYMREMTAVIRKRWPESPEDAQTAEDSSKPSAKDKRRYEICQSAIRAKLEEGTTFEDFIATCSYPTTTRTLRDWFKEFNLEWK